MHQTSSSRLERQATAPSTTATTVISSMAQRCGFFSGCTWSWLMVIMQPSFRMVMMTIEMTGSVNSPACASTCDEGLGGAGLAPATTGPYWWS